jgi:sulfoxide reductase catalytic subunit YedY
MLIKKPSDIPSSEITPKDRYLNRRKFLIGSGIAGLSLGTGAYLLGRGDSPAEAGQALSSVQKSQWTVESLGGDKLNSKKEITTYNNFYEFGTSKDDPAENAGTLRPRPWTVQVEGEVQKPQTIDIERILKLAPLEERVYRFRCVEAWSMVVPWVGYSFSKLAELVQPTSKAKYVAFTTLLDQKQMPGQNLGVLDWPYVEGLRIDEAMHPLCLLCVGLYGEALPNQNGAPMRIIVPWKYGFKSIKSLVRIRFVEKQPDTSWNKANASEYGFFSNVNPEVDHPRWSQATERRLGELRRRRTLAFNGYAEQVAGMYAGLDLRKFF